MEYKGEKVLTLRLEELTRECSKGKQKQVD